MAFQLEKDDKTVEDNIIEPKKNKTKDIISAILIIALLATWGYILWDRNNTKELLQQKDNLISTTSTERDQLQKELNDATTRYDLLKTSNAEKDSVINLKDQEIVKKQIKIKSLLSKINASATELSEAKDLILSLNSDIEGYKAQIALLEQQKAQLTKENAVVTADRNRIQKDFDSSVEQLKNRDKTIDVGSTLHASNFHIVGLNEKNSGKIKETTTAKKVDKLKISFDLDENMITQSGSKNLYIIITDPSGKVLSDESLGSASFKTRDGNILDFTEKMEINYIQNQRQTISFNFKAPSVFLIGDYKIEVYNNGFKIGQGVCPLKKVVYSGRRH
jgi:hypothetical protein